RAERAGQGRAAAARPADDRRCGASEQPEAGSSHAPRNRRRRAGPPRAYRVPPPAFPDDARGTRAFAHPAPRPSVGRPRVRGGAYRRRPHPPPAQGTRADRSRPPDPDRARRRLPLIQRLVPRGTGRGLSGIILLFHGAAPLVTSPPGTADRRG